MDRFSVDKQLYPKIKDIKNQKILSFTNQKEVFLYAMAMGVDAYTGTLLENSKEGLFLSKDLNESDKAIIYALVYQNLEKLEEISDDDKIISISEGIADIGFNDLLNDMARHSEDVFIKRLEKNIDDLYREAELKGYFDITN